jgi:ketosteroid isomerase-like protein
MRKAARLVMQRGWIGVLVAGALIAALAEPKAQPAPTGDEALVLAADAALGAAMRAGDKSSARKLLALQFSFVDEAGAIHERKDFLGELKAVAAAPASDPAVKIYGRIGMVTGHRKSVQGSDVFFLDIWAKQKGSWRALVAQDVVLAATDAPPGAPAAPGAAATPYDCKNPCQIIPYRVRSPAEQDVITSFQAIEKASVGHDAEEWSKHVADEFVLYGSGRPPIPKSDRIATIKRQKDSNAVVKVGEVETMRLAVYEDGAAMTATHTLPDNSRPPYRAARVWVKRNGQWLMAISVQTEVK